MTGKAKTQAKVKAVVVEQVQAPVEQQPEAYTPKAPQFVLRVSVHEREETMPDSTKQVFPYFAVLSNDAVRNRRNPAEVSVTALARAKPIVAFYDDRSGALYVLDRKATKVWQDETLRATLLVSFRTRVRDAMRAMWATLQRTPKTTTKAAKPEVEVEFFDVATFEEPEGVGDRGRDRHTVESSSNRSLVCASVPDSNSAHSRDTQATYRNTARAPRLVRMQAF
jgi:hypothetical protein